MSTMAESQLHEALDGLSAYEHGAHESGIHNERLRSRVFAQLRRMTDDELRVCIARFLQRFLCKEALTQGYGPGDVAEFLDWLSQNGIDF
jgi:hypothetical protein